MQYKNPDTGAVVSGLMMSHTNTCLCDTCVNRDKCDEHLSNCDIAMCEDYQVTTVKDAK